jgi:hypothetical protein
MPDFGRLLPELDRSEIPISISRAAVASVTSETGLNDISTVITVRFGYDWAAGDYTGSVTYHAPEEIKRYGRIERVIEAPWCPSARQAARLAEVWCKRVAGARWTTTVDGDRSLSAIDVGAIASLSHTLLPGGQLSSALVMAIDRNHESGAMNLTLDSAAASPPAVEISGWSGRFTPTSPSGTTVVIGAGVITLVIADDKGKTLPGAIAVLDGGKTATADASGRVVFRGVATGKHTIEIRATGYAPYTIEVMA